jgi:hypothetical protein
MAMSSKPGVASDAFAEFQKQTRELLRAQQEAYLAAVKAWREGLAKGAPPAWPQPPPENLQPNAGELAEASYAFAAKLLADQSKFMEELGKAMSHGSKGQR